MLTPDKAHRLFCSCLKQEVQRRRDAGRGLGFVMDELLGGGCYGEAFAGQRQVLQGHASHVNHDIAAHCCDFKSFEPRAHFSDVNEEVRDVMQTVSPIG